MESGRLIMGRSNSELTLEGVSIAKKLARHNRKRGSASGVFESSRKSRFQRYDIHGKSRAAHPPQARISGTLVWRMGRMQPERCRTRPQSDSRELARPPAWRRELPGFRSTNKLVHTGNLFKYRILKGF